VIKVTVRASNPEELRALLRALGGDAPLSQWCDVGKAAAAGIAAGINARAPPTMVTTIGKLDRVLSELLQLVGMQLDASDLQTLKHHADDMGGVADKLRQLLRLRGVQ
jgi:hypothetical protein